MWRQQFGCVVVTETDHLGAPLTTAPRGKPYAYAGPGLHGVAQIAAEVAGLVVGVVAAGQLAQALGKQKEALRKNPNHAFQSRPGFRLTSLSRTIPL